MTRPKDGEKQPRLTRREVEEMAKAAELTTIVGTHGKGEMAGDIVRLCTALLAADEALKKVLECALDELGRQGHEDCAAKAIAARLPREEDDE
jgi:hypothetical protein